MVTGPAVAVEALLAVGQRADRIVEQAVAELGAAAIVAKGRPCGWVMVSSLSQSRHGRRGGDGRQG